MQNSIRLEGRHLKNSRSAQRVTPTHNLYTESSYISQILAHQQKISDIPSSNKRLLNNLSPVSINYKEGKILQKNYLQNKYSMLQEGNQAQRAGWKKYLLEGFKEKIESIVNANKKTPKLFKIKRQLFAKSVALQASSIQDEYLTVNELIKRQNPSFDIEDVQEKLIQQHKLSLLKANRTDYDEKLLNIVKQFEIIVDRIEKEAFRVKIPANHTTAMQNYNDFYNVVLNQVTIQKTPRIMDFSKFDFKQRFKQSYAQNFWKEEDKDYELEQQPYTCRVSTQRECQEEILLEIQQFQQSLPAENIEEVVQEVQEIIEPTNNISTLQTEQIEEIPIKVPQEKKQKKKKNVRYRTKKNSTEEISSFVRKSKLEEHIQESQDNISKTDQLKYPFLDYMLSLDSVYDANLDKFRDKQIVEFDSYIFCDPDDEIVYQHQADWTCQLDYLLQKVD